MESVLGGVLKEELERNLMKQDFYANEIKKYPSGSLSVVVIHDDRYLYRKHREGKKIISEYIGPIDSGEAKKAYEDRKMFMKLKSNLSYLKEEEKKLRRTIKIYD